MLFLSIFFSQRNYKKLIPGAVYYGIEFVAMIAFVIVADREFTHFGSIMSVIMGTIFIGIMQSIRTFYLESKSKNEKKLLSQNMSYLHLKPEKV